MPICVIIPVAFGAFVGAFKKASAWLLITVILMIMKTNENITVITKR